MCWDRNLYLGCAIATLQVGQARTLDGHCAGMHRVHGSMSRGTSEEVPDWIEWRLDVAEPASWEVCHQHGRDDMSQGGANIPM